MLDSVGTSNINDIVSKCSRGQNAEVLWKMERSLGQDHEEFECTRERRTLILRVAHDAANDAQFEHPGYKALAALNIRFEHCSPRDDNKVQIVLDRGNDYSFVGEEPSL